METKLDLNLEQKLILTPQMRQSLEILQFNTMQLDEYIEKAIQENPVIERSEKKTVSYGEPVSLDIPDFKLENLREHLENELLSSNLRYDLMEPARAIIDKVDDDGYITIPKSSLAKELKLGIEELKEIFRVIYSMEPAGIGAYNLEQCLELQLRAKGRFTKMEYQVLHEYLDELLSNKLRYIADKTGVDIYEIQRLADEVKTLDPKPGRAYSSCDENRYIVADVIIEAAEEGYNVFVNDAYGIDIHINEEYEKMYKENKGNAEITEFLKNMISVATILANSIDQRKRTLLKITNVIVEEQNEFLRKGELYMKPLTYDMVAERAAVHKSTVGRTVKGKYALTPMGIVPLKAFFGSGIGDSASLAVKLMIKQIIDEEDKARPLSDNTISEILTKRGIKISRRTVTKYRESAGILDSRRRRRFDL